MKLENMFKIGAVSVGLAILLQSCGTLFAPNVKFQEYQKQHQEQVSRVQEDYSLIADTTVYTALCK